MATIIQIAMMSIEDKKKRIVEIETIINDNAGDDVFYSFVLPNLRAEYETLLRFLRTNKPHAPTGQTP